MKKPILLLTFSCSLSLHGQDHAWIPAVQGIELINPDYVVDFDTSRNVAFWVAYELLPAETAGEAKRKSSFQTDTRVDQGPMHGDYTHSGFDRGHMKPAADSKSSQERMDASFLMTNVAPQTPALNRGSWKRLEESVRSWAEEYGAIHVVCGPGLETTGTLGQDRIAIPTHYWKAVLRTSPDTACIAFMLPNRTDGIESFSSYRLSVDSLEAVIDLDLFPALPSAIERRIERNLSTWSE